MQKQSTPLGKRLASLLLAGSIACFIALTSASAAEPATKQFDIPADTAEKSLKIFSAQAGVEYLLASDASVGVKTNAVKGEFTPIEAAKRMLEGTELYVRDDSNGVVRIGKADPNGPRLAQKNSDQPNDQSKIEGGVIKLETFEVMGSKLLNMDIRRSRDDSQPYVIFDRQLIEQSGATSVDEFLRKRLSSNSVAVPPAQVTIGATGAHSVVDLRGLGANQTLILIDGHRAAGDNNSGGLVQPDINGIPLSAIERIVVLPATASGIYGGGATGGVVNIILRQDYSGFEVKLTYDNTFDTDSRMRSFDFSGGVNLAKKTHLMFAGSFSDANALTAGARAFQQRGIAQILARSPNGLLGVPFNGNPPIAATPNIISTDGSNLVLKNGTALNSPITYVPAGYAGMVAGDGGNALVGNAGRWNFNPVQGPTYNSSSIPFAGTGSTLIFPPRRTSLTATLRHEFMPSVQAFVEALGDHEHSEVPLLRVLSGVPIPVSSPTNPFQQPIKVSTVGGLGKYQTISGRIRLTGGLVVKLPADWQGEADYTWNRNKIEYFQSLGLDFTGRAAAVNSGALDLLRDTALYPLDTTGLNINITAGPYRTTMKDASLRLSGPVGVLPAGRPTLTGLVEYRSEATGFGSSIQRFVDPAKNGAIATQFDSPDSSESVQSAAVHGDLPLLSARQKILAAQALSLQVDLRHDKYTTHGVTQSISSLAPTPISRNTVVTQSTDYTVAFHWELNPNLAIRGSYGTGFLPPTVYQILPFTPVTTNTITDPRRGNTSYVVPLTIQGGNPSLKPESSTTRSVGLIFTPQFLSGFRVSLDYLKLEKSNEIKSVTTALLLQNESLFPSRVQRGPTLPGDPAGYAGPVTLLDTSNINLAHSTIEAFDLQLNYDRNLGEAGKLGLAVIGTYQPHYQTQFLSTSPLVENASVEGTLFSVVLKKKGSAALTWARNQWTVGWSSNYYGEYYVADPTNPANATTFRSQGNGGKVPFQLIHDVTASYDFGFTGERGSPWRILANSKVTVGVRNVFNTAPEVDTGFLGFYSSYASAFVDPRLRSYFVSIKKQF